MESTARLVLSALARSNVLRLRGDAFTPTLDDLPLSRSSQGSSCLAAKAFVDNFSSLSAAATTSVCSNLFLDPQARLCVSAGSLLLLLAAGRRSLARCAPSPPSLSLVCLVDAVAWLARVCLPCSGRFAPLGFVQTSNTHKSTA
jgi:hypothetical protein